MILVIAFYIYKYEDKNIITNNLCKIVAKYSFNNYFKTKNIR